jgi:hypothetical protein
VSKIATCWHVRQNRIASIPEILGGLCSGARCCHFLDRIKYGIVDHHRLGELLTAMDDTVADSRNLADVAQDAMLRVGQGFDDQVHGHVVIGALGLLFVLFTAGHFMGDKGTADDNTLDNTFGDNFFLCPVKQLVFDRRASAVNGKNIHLPSS